MNGNIYNAKIYPPAKLAAGITVRFVVENYQPQLVLVIDDSTTIRGIENEWHKIKIIREEMHKYFGTKLGRGHKDVLFELSEMNKQGRGWVEIEKILNYRCLACLSSAFLELEDNSITLGSALLAIHIMALTGKIEEIQVIFDAGFDDLRMNRIPWKLRKGLFDNYQIRQKVKDFRKQVVRGAVHIPEERDPEIDADDMILYLKGYYENVNTYLQNTDRMYWKENEEWIRKRLKSISEKIETSNDPEIERIRDI
jgi:hypothetical protein